MKNKLISFFFRVMLSLCILLYSIFSFSSVSRADVPSSQIVEGHTSTWAGLPFVYTTNGKYYTVEDPTGIPSSTLLAPNYFYTVDNVKFFQVNGLKLFTGILNKLVGVIYEPNELNSLFTGFLNATNGLDTVNNKYSPTGLYDSNDNFLGYCLNDISGCYYGGNPPSGSNVKDDGNYSNNVKNYIDYEKQQGNFDIPDYFTFYGLSDNYIMSNLTTSLNSTQYSNYQQFRYDHDVIYGYCYDSFYNKRFFHTAYNAYSGPLDEGYIIGVDDVKYLVNAYPSNWKNFIVGNVQDGILLGSDFIYTNVGAFIWVNCFDSSNNRITTGFRYNVYGDGSSESSTQTLFAFASGNYHCFPFNFEKITVYKDVNIANNFENQIYQPSVYYTDSFNNYDTNNDNSVDIPITQINQSVSSNTSIYDTSSENFYNYYDNGFYDQSSATTNITNITNNYYGSGGGDNPGNPDNPDNPDDPNDVLSQILQALLRFFTAIGSVLGTILTGLLTIFSEILESIATVTEDLTNIGDFFGSIFAWIPEPVPEVLGLGFSICILCGIIKFIRG